jgi:hypothetical protein
LRVKHNRRPVRERAISACVRNDISDVIMWVRSNLLCRWCCICLYPRYI